MKFSSRIQSNNCVARLRDVRSITVFIFSTDIDLNGEPVKKHPVAEDETDFSMATLAKGEVTQVTEYCCEFLSSGKVQNAKPFW